jgi:tetratricopeptide (TPR) repeat protein
MALDVVTGGAGHLYQVPLSHQMACGHHQGEKPPAEVFGERIILPLITKTTNFFHGLSLFVAPAFTSIQNAYTHLTSGVSFPTLLPVVGAQSLSDYDQMDGEPAEKVQEANHYNAMGTKLSCLGLHTQALGYVQKALKIVQEMAPPDHRDLMAGYSNVGLALRNLERHEQALEYMQKALEVAQKALPSNHVDLAASYSNVGMVLMRLGRHAEALQHMQKALEISEKVFLPDDPKLAFLNKHIEFNLKQHTNQE